MSITDPVHDVSFAPNVGRQVLYSFETVDPIKRAIGLPQHKLKLKYSISCYTYQNLILVFNSYVLHFLIFCEVT